MWSMNSFHEFDSPSYLQSGLSHKHKHKAHRMTGDRLPGQQNTGPGRSLCFPIYSGSLSHFTWGMLCSGALQLGCALLCPRGQDSCRLQKQQHRLPTMGAAAWSCRESPEILQTIMRSEPKSDEEKEFISRYWLAHQCALNPRDHSIMESANCILFYYPSPPLSLLLVIGFFFTRNAIETV